MACVSPSTSRRRTCAPAATARRAYPSDPAGEVMRSRVPCAMRTSRPASWSTGSPASHQGASATTPATCASPATQSAVRAPIECPTRTIADVVTVPAPDLVERPSRVADGVGRRTIAVPAAEAIAEPIGRHTCPADRSSERQHPQRGELTAARAHPTVDAPTLEDEGHPIHRCRPGHGRAGEAGRASDQSNTRSAYPPPEQPRLSRPPRHAGVHGCCLGSWKALMRAGDRDARRSPD